MTDQLTLIAAQTRLVNGPSDFRTFLDYVRVHGIDTSHLFGFAGACVITAIIDCGNCRFEFGHGETEQIPAFVCEAYGTDGETVIDLVAWPLDRPLHVMSMFGRSGLLGAWEAMNPATYCFDGPLNVHKSPLDWLRADCQGAAIVTPHVAARMFLDIPGKLAAQDIQHGRDLERLVQSIAPRDRVVLPRAWRAVA